MSSWGFGFVPLLGNPFGYLSSILFGDTRADSLQNMKSDCILLFGVVLYKEHNNMGFNQQKFNRSGLLPDPNLGTASVTELGGSGSLSKSQ